MTVQEDNRYTQKPKQHFITRVANQLADQLRDGTAPTQRQGVQDIPYNPASGRTYHGINAMSLMMQGRKDDRWLTFEDASMSGYKVKRGEKGTPVQYWPKKKPGETMNKAITTYVFNAEQLDRIPPMPLKPERPDPIERVSNLLKEIGVTVIHDQAERSFYAPRKDEIHLPEPEKCASTEKYCEMAIHEYFRATGHPSRQDRDTFNAISEGDRAKEELICATATMMMCAEIGIPHDPNRNPELAHDWARAMEHHPFEFAQSMQQVDNAVWASLRLEHAQNTSLGLQAGDAWRPVPDASPALAVETYINRNTTLELAQNEPEKVHTFEYQNREIFALPDTGSVLSKEPSNQPNGEVNLHVKTEAYDRDGNTYSVTMQYSAITNVNGLAELTAPATATEIVPTTKNMSLPMDWSGQLEVRGCVEDIDGNIRSDITDEEQIQFYGVYANTQDGRQQHLADFDTLEHANRYAGLIDGEHRRQTQTDTKQEQRYTTERANTTDRTEARQEQTASQEKVVPDPKEPEISPRDECIAAMKSLGMIVTGEHPVFDKKPHRIEVDGDKKGERSGFYVAHPDGRPSGYCKNNRTGEEKKWSVKGYVLDDKQKQALHKEARENVAKRDDDLKKTHDRTAKRLQGQIKKYAVPNEPTAYMKTKDIQLHPGVYQNGSSTCVPLYNTSGEVRSMAYVQEDGTKRYAKNSEKEGCFHAIGGLDAVKKAPVCIITEGYATAATIKESVGLPVVAAMDAGNLVDVAKAIRADNPDIPIIIAGDNDAKQEAEKGKNPGVNYALKAAEAVNGVAVFPAFSGQASKDMSDFNDLARMHGELGKDAVKGQVQPAIEKEIAAKAERTKEAKVEKERGQKELARA